MHRKPIAAAFSGLLALTVALPVLAADIDAFKGLSGKLDIAGGTAHIPVVQDIARQVSKANPAIRISVTGGGSGVGVQKVGEGLVDIGSTGRKVSAEEIARYQLKPFHFALDGVAVAVHPSNPVKDISLAQLRDVFSGKMTNWKALGGADAPIHLYGRDEASATREVFVGKVLGKDIAPAAKTTLVSSNGAAKSAIARDKGAIGYLGMGMLDQSIKPLSVDGHAPTQQNALSGDYPIVRGLYFNTKGEPAALPGAFLRYLKTNEGQAIIRSHGYIPAF
ncbi:phosphate ABC transporter substrate-binding protein [Craterilacuibacter sp. RT1T]|uniref:phosphate ABC transporter substrate-binding protein n=1 Tax=Craterilacuibacter sp. RT1T TaxID=2942211 RepID=UPI0020BFF8D7|nr:phosphate ABC transporter substrate-binding protein [Craterilacuibacter sp. RT1T]MCL6261779.1 phosphate ABC transporter substrate-binding protein [Craterilacuibacter sp. RT1T]